MTVDHENRVLAAVDRGPLAHAVADAAIWAAGRLARPLEFLHVLDRHPEQAAGEDRSGAIGLDAQDHLLQALSARDAENSRQAREAGRLFLAGLRARALAAGFSRTDVRLRHGALVDTLLEQAAGVDLFVLGRGGATGEHAQRLGQNLASLVQRLPQLILTVHRDFAAPQRCLIAFDGSAMARRGIEHLRHSPLLAGLDCHLLLAGSPGREALRALAQARSTLENDGFSVCVHQLPGEASSQVPRLVRDEGIGLLAMGAFQHAAWRRLLLGSRTNALLRSAEVPTLLWR
ncbi:MAG: universal stress protein [Rhodocyclaceae bacterium]|nr:universal stress protein [Rhodocyclaceae bacterium]